MPDPSKVYSGSGMVESKSVGTFSPLQKQDGHRGLFVDRGVGSPRLVKSASATTFTTDLKLDSETKVCDSYFLLAVKIVQVNYLPCIQWWFLVVFICVLFLLIVRMRCQLLLELLQLQLWLIRCLDQRRIDIWQLSWYFPA